MYLVEASSLDHHLSPEEGIDQAGESANVGNYNNRKHLTDFILDVIPTSYGRTQEIHYCNQSVSAIVPDLNIFVFSIKIFFSFREAP